ncbi:MAG: oxidoreductase [Bdellovibrio sp.]|jgi:uncharacterized protein YbjT (DUF2867 family)
MNVAIAGATGLVGSECLNLLQSEAEVKNIEVFARRALQLPGKAKFKETDFINFQKGEALDAGLCALGTTIRKAGSEDQFYKVDHDFILNFARHCLARGAQKFIVVSALGADPQSRFFYSRVKGKTERDLRQLNFKSLVILRPSLLLGDRQEHRPVEQIASFVAPLLSPLMIGPLRAGRPIQGWRVAKQATESLFRATAKNEIILNAQMLERS